MYLRFFGRDAGFGYEHTSAYFTTDNKDLVIIDLPVSTFQKLKNTKSINLKDHNIYILITHTHGDHIGGLGLFIQYAQFVLKVPVTVIAPSETVACDIETVLIIEGIEPHWYSIMTPDDAAAKKWFNRAILTKHSPQLEGKCFGYELTINNTNVIYTSDTSTLEPFIPYLTDNSVLYVDVSVYYGMIHLKLEDALHDLISLSKKVKFIYLMHLDDAHAAYNIIENCSKIKIVDLSPC